MLSAYIRAAMAHATHRKLEGSGRFFLEIPEIQGVWADADSLEAGRVELQEVLEDWIALGIATHQHIPVIDGVDINLQHAAGVGR